jgi:plastocyanin
MKYLNALFLFSYIFLFSTFTFAQTVHVVEVRNYMFVPESLSIAVNDTVEWQWIEGTHTTTSDSTTGENVWNSPIDASHQVFRLVITSSGNHDYHCIPHQSLGMVGTIMATAVTSVDDGTNQLDKFQLSQNYPNPFNPATTISFSLSKQSHVTLEIYNSLGEKVSTLVSGFLATGNYKYRWNAEGLAGGIYFYKLKAGDFVESKKMVLIQ